jgi:DNA-binding transcriptional ArsR family regulator
MDSIVYENKKKFSFQASEVDGFAMVFYHCIAAMYGIESQKTLSLLCELCRHAQPDTGIVEVSANIRRRICNDADINITNFSKHMKVLKEAELIKDRGGCSYLINPRAFWKGSSKHEDCTFYVEFGIK